MSTTTETTTTKTVAKRAPVKRAASRAKAPQDHKPAASKTVNGFRVGIVRGIEWRIPVDKLDDWDLMQNLQRNNVIPAAEAMFDDEQMEKAKGLVRDPKTGRVPYSEMFTLCTEILRTLAPSS